MYKIICLLGLVAAATAASIGSVETTTVRREIVPVLNFETDKKPDGSFSFTYEGGDKTFREESGVLENAGTDDEALEVSGSYRYIDADGREVEVHYTAGRNGFVPVGTNILSEITALARAAADLPDHKFEEENNRRARSKVEKTDEVKVKKVERERIEKVEKIEKIEKPVEKVQKNEKVDKVDKVPVVVKPKEPVIESVKKPVEATIKEPIVEKTKEQEKVPVAEPVKTADAEKPTDVKPIEKPSEVKSEAQQESKPDTVPEEVKPIEKEEPATKA